jgi:hypothetical protein
LSQIPYHAPGEATEILQWQQGALPDPQNIFDTPETVAVLRAQNGAIGAVCDKGTK